MNRHQPYSPRRCLQPLKGFRGTRAASVSCRALPLREMLAAGERCPTELHPFTGKVCRAKVFVLNFIKQP